MNTALYNVVLENWLEATHICIIFRYAIPASKIMVTSFTITMAIDRAHALFRPLASIAQSKVFRMKKVCEMYNKCLGSMYVTIFHSLISVLV